MENANDSAFMLLDFATGAHAMLHVGNPNIAGPGLRHTGQTVVVHGRDGTVESRGDPWISPAVSKLTGLRRGAEHGPQTLAVPDSYYGGTDPNEAFAVFRQDAVGPRLFIDAIVHDFSISPSFYDGHQVQRVIDAAVESLTCSTTSWRQRWATPAR